MIVEIDPAEFIELTLIDPETCELFRLTEAEIIFLRHAFELTRDGRLKYPELVFSGPKKSGKTGFAAMILIYVVRVLGGRYAEGFCVANSHDQASLRVFQAAARIVEASPLLSLGAKVTTTTINVRLDRCDDQRDSERLFDGGWCQPDDQPF